jgi:hypothetical protein
MISYNRRKFIQATTLAAVGTGIAGNTFGKQLNQLYSPSITRDSLGYIDQGRVGIIGLDTSHVIAFSQSLNADNVRPELAGFKVVAAYPHGTKDIAYGLDRKPKFIQQIKGMGIELVDSIDDLLKKVDVVLLESNDGRVHLEQLIPVLKAGKRVFIDKPISNSLQGAVEIFKQANKYNIAVFSSSSLRFAPQIQSLANGKLGKVLGADTYSPAHLEKTHPDLFWYGIHGVEILYTLMGTGCKNVARTSVGDTEIAVGTWADGRVGVFRGLRAGKLDYGGTVFCEKGIESIVPYTGYMELLIQIVNYFRTGEVPVKPEVTLEMLAFMEAADVSKKIGGRPVELQQVSFRN